MSSVHVTGVGLTTPLGTSISDISSALAEARVVCRIPDGPEGLFIPSPRVATLPGSFDPSSSVRRRKDRKLKARTNVLALSAARSALEQAGIAEDSAALIDAGLFVAVGREPGDPDDVLPALAASRDESDPTEIDLGRLATAGTREMNPVSSIKTLPNMSHAHVAMHLGIMGVGMTTCAGPGAGLVALAEGISALIDGRASLALVGATDARTSFPDRISAAREDDVDFVSEAAVFLVIETETAMLARGGRSLGLAESWLDAEADEVVVSALGACGAARTLTALAITRCRTDAPEMIRPLLTSPRRSRTSPRSRVAITGIGLRTPLGRSFDEFKRRLLSGESAVGPIRAFDASAFPTRLACEISDHDLEHLPPELAEAFRGLDDRKGELALAAALDALRDHGEALPAGAALTYGTGLSSVSRRELCADALPYVDAAGRFDYERFASHPPARPHQAPRRHDVDRPMALLRAHLGLSGPYTGHFSACAAGAAAIGHAADQVRRGEVEVALAGAADSMIHPFGLLPFILLGAASPNSDPKKAARPFDKHRDGFVMGEAGVFFVLEREDRARAAGRRIYGYILGHGTSADAHNVTAPHPEGAGAERAMRRALADAGLRPEHVDYINAHGTGTPLNDVVEAGAIARVFGLGSSMPPTSSCKAQLGHAIAAAGALELAACLAAFDGGHLPPNPHTTEVDARIDIHLVGREAKALMPAVIASNSFGFGGQNATLVLGHAGRSDTGMSQ